MTRAVLARQSRVSLPTVNRILSGKHRNAAFANVAAVGQALGIDLAPVSRETVEALLIKRARHKAMQMICLVQGSFGLAGQTVDQETVESMVVRASERLLRSKKRLWAE